MLHIEITGDMSRKEWEAVAAVAAVMLGTVSREALAAGSSHPLATAARWKTESVTIPAPPPQVPLDDVLPPSIVEGTGGDPSSDAPPASSGAVAVDSDGLPWDMRIHASTKTQTKDGKWTKKRGSDANLIAHVEAELRSVMAAPAPGAVPAPPAAGGVPMPPTVTDPAAAFGSASASPPAAEAPPPASPLAEFARIMRVVSQKQAAGLVTTEFVTGLAQQLGLTSLSDLAKRPDLIPGFEALLP